MTVQRRFTRAVVIGAGFSGIATGCRFKKDLGFHDFTIYERSSSLGGTWWLNQYPGCGVDVPAVLYSLSFAPNPNFSRLFPDQQEILEYLEKVANDYDVTSHIKFGASWDSAHWQEETKTWLLKLTMVETGEVIEHECKVLISAVGRLVHPNPFEIPGQQDFEGQIVHSARWKKGVDLKDKNVAVIGNGCSGSQIVPAIAGETKNVYHFMRTPQYYIPKPLDHRRIRPRAKFILRFVPGLFRLFRLLVFVYLEWTFRQFYLDEDATKSRNTAQTRSRKYVEKTAPRKYWDLLTPNYAIGCKRRILDPGYLKALHRENVQLTDDRIAALSSNGLITKSGRHYPADVIIVANGFDPFRYEFNIVGRHGQTLEDHWREFGGIEAYKTTALAGFPNMFLLSGPNSIGGHNSSVFSIENTINLVLKVVKPVLTHQIDEVEVKLAAEKKWTQYAQAALKDRVYSDNCATYYVDQKTGWNFYNYPWSFYHLWFITAFPSMADWSFTPPKLLQASAAWPQTRMLFGSASALGLLAAWCLVSYVPR